MSLAKIKKILVPLDGSENSFRALDKAIILAKQNDAEITGFFVIQINPSEIDIIRNIMKKSFKKQFLKIMEKANAKCKKMIQSLQMC